MENIKSTFKEGLMFLTIVIIIAFIFLTIIYFKRERCVPVINTEKEKVIMKYDTSRICIIPKTKNKNNDKK